MRNLFKLLICLFIATSFTACYPLLMNHRGGPGRGWDYNNQHYNTRREYRTARYHGRDNANASRNSNENSGNNYNNGNQRER